MKLERTENLRLLFLYPVTRAAQLQGRAVCAAIVTRVLGRGEQVLDEGPRLGNAPLHR